MIENKKMIKKWENKKNKKIRKKKILKLRRPVNNEIC